MLVALCLSKVSVLSFSRRIFNGDLHAEKIIFSVALALTVAWFILAILLSSAGCTPKNILIAQENALCSANVSPHPPPSRPRPSPSPIASHAPLTPKIKQEARWAVITALDVITEIMLLAIPVWLVSKNQIKTSKKRVVAFVFAFRLVVAGFAIAAAVSYFNFLRGDRDNIGLSATVAWQEVLLGVSLISASIPSLRSFLWAFMSRSMLTMYGIDSKVSQSGSIPMRSVNKSARSMNRSTARSAARSMNRSTHSYGANADGSQNLPDDDEAQEHKNASRLRPDWMQYSVDIGRGKPRGGGAKPVKETGSQSDDSEQMIIHRNVEFEVN